MTSNLLLQTQGQAVNVSLVDEFMEQVRLQHLNLNRILRFVDDQIGFYYNPDDPDAILLATLIKDDPKTEISRVEYIAAIKYLAFVRVAQNSFLMGQSLWSAVISQDKSHYWVSYL